MSDHIARLTHVTNTDGDWEAIYNNGRLLDGVEQNHSLDWFSVLTTLVGEAIISVDHFEADMEEGMADWLGDRGFPEYLSDIPQEARSK